MSDRGDMTRYDELAEVPSEAVRQRAEAIADDPLAVPDTPIPSRADVSLTVRGTRSWLLLRATVAQETRAEYPTVENWPPVMLDEDGVRELVRAGLRWLQVRKAAPVNRPPIGTPISEASDDTARELAQLRSVVAGVHELVERPRRGADEWDAVDALLNTIDPAYRPWTE